MKRTANNMIRGSSLFAILRIFLFQIYQIIDVEILRSYQYNYIFVKIRFWLNNRIITSLFA